MQKVKHVYERLSCVFAFETSKFPVMYLNVISFFWQQTGTWCLCAIPQVVDGLGIKESCGPGRTLDRTVNVLHEENSCHK